MSTLQATYKPLIATTAAIPSITAGPANNRPAPSQLEKKRKEFDAMVRQYHGQLLGYARHLFNMANRPECAIGPDDLVMMTFERIWKYSSQPEKYPKMQYDPTRNGGTSYYTFCRLQLKNLFWDLQYRREEKLRAVPIEALMEHSDSGKLQESVPPGMRLPDVYHDVADRDACEHILSTLTETERMLALLRLDGLIAKDIAKLTGIKKARVYEVFYALRRARQA